MRIIDLKQKEVINTCNCKTLGCPVDVEFDPCSGRISAVHHPGPAENSAVFSEETANSVFPGNASVRSGKILFLWKSMRKKCLKKL